VKPLEAQNMSAQLTCKRMTCAGGAGASWRALDGAGAADFARGLGELLKQNKSGHQLHMMRGVRLTKATSKSAMLFIK
jgi:hypothetical protein